LRPGVGTERRHFGEAPRSSQVWDHARDAQLPAKPRVLRGSENHTRHEKAVRALGALKARLRPTWCARSTALRGPGRRHFFSPQPPVRNSTYKTLRGEYPAHLAPPQNACTTWHSAPLRQAATAILSHFCRLQSQERTEGHRSESAAPCRSVPRGVCGVVERQPGPQLATPLARHYLCVNTIAQRGDDPMSSEPRRALS
jgi:hypothetical protein